MQDRPSPLWPEEVAAVESAVKRHPKAHNCRVGVKGDRIVVYERIGPDTHDLLAEFKGMGPFSPGQVKGLQETLDRHAQFTPVLRFILADAEQRAFRAERWCYLGSIDDWIYIGQWESIDQLASELIPALGPTNSLSCIRRQWKRCDSRTANHPAVTSAPRPSQYKDWAASGNMPPPAHYFSALCHSRQ
jgi:hypothetical protein